jgi:hypothetical protein
MTAWYEYPVTQGYGVNNEKGVDIGTPFHTQITNLYAGTVTDVSRHGWGYQVGVLTSLPGIGPVIEYFQHLDVVNVVKGQVLKVGDLIGLSGGQTSGGNAPNDPTYSSGPHTEFGFDAPWIGGVTSSMPNFNPTNFLKPSTDTTTSTGTGSGTCDFFDIPCNVNALNDQIKNINNAFTATDKFMSALSQPDTWTQIGLIVFGIVMIVVALILIFKE